MRSNKSVGYYQLPRNRCQYGRGQTARLKVAAIAMGLIVVLVIVAAMFSTSDSATQDAKRQVQLETSPSTGTQAPALSAEYSEIQALKSQYDQCMSDLNIQKSQVDGINARMAAYDAAGDTDAYNALVPEQNRTVNAYNAKRDECNNLQSQYNAKVDDYNGKLQSN